MDLPPAVVDTATFTEHVVETPMGSRRYRLFVPAGSGDGSPRPLLVVLHGCTQDARDIARGTRFNRHAARVGLLVLYPEQPASANPQKCWNWFLPAHQHRGTGEPALIADFTRRVMASHPVDPGRVYLTGVSAGGAMAVIAAIAYPDLYAALAVHSGISYQAAEAFPQALAAMRGEGRPPGETAAAAHAEMGPRARAIPLFVMQGAADPSVRVGNAPQLSEQFVTLAALAGVGPSPPVHQTETVAGREVAKTIWSEPSGRPLVEQWIVAGLAHAWSGGSAEGTWTDPAGPDASAEIVRFVRQHRHPAPGP